MHGAMIEKIDKTFFNHTVTGNETWVYGHAPKTKQQ